MKMGKTVLAAVMSVILLLSAVPIFTVSALEYSTTAEEKLIALEILTENDIPRSAGSVTRSEFVVLAMKVSNEMELISMVTGELPYSDVSSSDAAAPYLSAALARGYLSVPEDGMFNPDQEITVAQAIKILVSVVGYQEIAEQSGGYPTGYLAIASQLGVLREVSLRGDEPLMLDVMLELILDFLEADLLEMKTVGSYGEAPSVEYVSQKGKSLLTERFSIYEGRGTVEANAYTQLLTPESPLKTGNILIGAEEYVLKNGDATELLGNTISFYYRQKRGQELPELLYAESVGHSERLELEGKDILSAGNSGLTYQGESRVQTARFSSYAAVIKNGKMVPFSADDFMPENGTLTLIDNDGDGYYDVLKVMDYETYVVLETGDSGYEVTTRSGVTLSFDPEEQGCDIVIIKNGAAASYDQLAAGDVISYAASSGAGRNLKTALVSSETVSGDIQEIDDEGITVGGNYYEAVESVRMGVSVGKSATFYQDVFGRLVDMDNDVRIVYGYLTKMAREGAFGAVQCKIFTENDRFVTLAMSSKLKFNGNTGVDALTVAQTLGWQQEEYQQLITYRVNDEAEIIELNTAQSYEPCSEEEEQAIKENVFRLSKRLDNSVYYRAPQSFSADAGIADDAIFFVIPQDKSQEEMFEIWSVSDMESDSAYNVSVYDADKAQVSSVFLLDAPQKPINSSSSIGTFMIVDCVIRMIGQDGEEKPGIKGTMQGTKVTLPVQSQSVLDAVGTLHQGDVIQFASDSRQEISQISRAYAAEEGWQQTFSDGNPNSSRLFLAGEVTAITKTRNYFQVRYGSSSYRVFSTRSGPNRVYLYDTKLGYAAVGSAADIMTGDYILLSCRYNQLQEMVIFR